MGSTTGRNQQGDCCRHVSPNDVTYHSLQSLFYLLCRITPRLGGTTFLFRTHFWTILENVSRRSLERYQNDSSDRQNRTSLVNCAEVSMCRCCSYLGEIGPQNRTRQRQSLDRSTTRYNECSHYQRKAQKTPPSRGMTPTFSVDVFAWFAPFFSRDFIKVRSRD